MRRYAGPLLLLAATIAGAQDVAVPRGWDAKNDVLEELGALHEAPVHVDYALSPLAFLWLTSGSTVEFTKLEDIARYLHRSNPGLGSIAEIHAALTDELLEDVRATVAQTDREAVKAGLQSYARQLGWPANALRPWVYNGTAVVDMDLCLGCIEDPYRVGLSAKYELRIRDGRLAVQLLEGNRLPGSADDAVDFARRLFRANQRPGLWLDRLVAPVKSTYARGILEFFFQRKVGARFFDTLTNEQLIGALARDPWTRAHLLRVYARTETDAAGLKAVMQAARRIRAWKFGTIYAAVAAGVAGSGYLLWEWLRPDTPTEINVGKSIGAVYGDQPPDWDVKAYLVDLIENTADIDTLRQSIVGMDDRVAEVLWDYLFVPKDEG